MAVGSKSNPELYNEAVLKADYLNDCDWIMKITRGEPSKGILHFRN